MLLGIRVDLSGFPVHQCPGRVSQARDTLSAFGGDCFRSLPDRRFVRLGLGYHPRRLGLARLKQLSQVAKPKSGKARGSAQLESRKEDPAGICPPSFGAELAVCKASLPTEDEFVVVGMACREFGVRATNETGFGVRKF